MAKSKLDATLDDVQNTRFANIYHDLIKTMSKQTQFNEMEVSSILMLYHKFLLANDPRSVHRQSMTRKQFFQLFLVLFKIYDLQIIERIVTQISTDTKKEVDPVAFVKLFSVFMTRKLEQKMKFAFQIYNLQGNGLLNREIVTHAVEKFFTGEDEDEVNELRSDMVDLLFKKFDVDKDGFISYDDYSSVVIKQPLLLEFLGQCFPSQTGLTVMALCANIMSKMCYDKETGF